MDPILSLKGVEKVYLPGPVAAVTGLDLDVKQGEILTLLGPSGCGKTTTLRLLAGFERPDAGTIRVGGRVVAGEGAWVPPEHRGVGMVFQDYALFPHLTVGDNVTFGLHRMKRSDRRARAEKVLKILDLPHVIDRYPHELSGGQQQRVALARALAPEPLVVLMDEPFSNLDAHLRNNVRDEVVSILRRSGITTILVSHDQRDALAIPDRVAVMNRGRLEQVGSPREIYKHPASIFVATFVGRTNLLAGTIHGVDGCVLTDFGSFCSVDRTGLAGGTPVVVSVRPDGFRPDDPGTLRGTLISACYTGPNVEAEIAVPRAGGGERNLLVHLPPGRTWLPGEAIGLSLVPDFASVVRNACDTLGFQSPGAGAQVPPG
jgi:iron(III) transport system ATP-binding protein